MQELEKEEWYHGMIPIEDAKSMLHQNADFLVRKTEREKKSSPRENISLEKKTGEGEYGEVWRGKLKAKTEESVDVAVKLLVFERLKSPYSQRITQIPTVFSSYHSESTILDCRELATLRLDFYRNGGDVLNWFALV
ncbi:hypothetical protein KIN20_007639 [Parelaphostrongylus tenuis]|uniref:SH2 domain-containing protein n=1 Tax=Parelaphostrongylus tenuis TaxID=148309 RepID=A0AAD5QK48_PARTN|nr:hypothetical protein KIN20_007639 [Parelaphostrongylus tenuis]